MTPDDVIGFWLGRAGDPHYGQFRQEWFAKEEAFDRAIRARFLPLCEAAARGGHDPWREEARSALALVIVLDQFPRNMFRGEARSFATDRQALEVAAHA